MIRAVVGVFVMLMSLQSFASNERPPCAPLELENNLQLKFVNDGDLFTGEVRIENKVTKRTLFSRQLWDKETYATWLLTSKIDSCALEPAVSYFWLMKKPANSPIQILTASIIVDNGDRLYGARRFRTTLAIRLKTADVLDVVELEPDDPYGRFSGALIGAFFFKDDPSKVVAYYIHKTRKGKPGYFYTVDFDRLTVTPGKREFINKCSDVMDASHLLPWSIDVDSEGYFVRNNEVRLLGGIDGFYKYCRSLYTVTFDQNKIADGIEGH
jgi:hypothetical protein